MALLKAIFLMLSCSILLVIGIPASGKTSLGHYLKQSLSKSYQIIHLSFDDLINQEAFLKGDYDEFRSNFKLWRTILLSEINDWLHQNFYSSKKDLSHLDYKPDPYVQRKIKEKLYQLLPNKKDLQIPWCLLLDDNFYLQSMRHVYFTLAKHYRLGFGEIFCEVDLKKALVRNDSRPIPVECATIDKMAKQFEKPNPENSWEQFFLTIESSTDPADKLSKVQDLIQTISSNPFNTDYEDSIRDFKLQNQIVCSTNTLHIFDDLLRKAVNRIMLDKERDWKRQHGKQFSEIKSKLLDKFKRNDLECEINLNDEKSAVSTIVKLFETMYTLPS